MSPVAEGFLQFVPKRLEGSCTAWSFHGAAGRTRESLRQALADEADGEHRRHDGKTRRDDDVGRRPQHGAAFGDHGAPARDVGIAQAQERQGRFRQDRARDDDRRERDERG